MARRLISTLLPRRADWRDDLSAYVDDELSPRERASVEARLAESVEMRDYLADLEQMRSVLRNFEPQQSAAPFQLTTEMLDDSLRVSVRQDGTARALRLSMSTAAVGVATFAAVMVFDAVDSPTVTFTTTSADEQALGVPTAVVATDDVEVQVESQSAAVSSASDDADSPQPVQAQVAEESAEVEQSVAATTEAAESSESQQEAAIEEAAAEQAAPQEQAQASLDEQAAEQAAADPSRRALTAGRGGGTSDAQPVSAEDVVAQDETADAQAASEPSSEPETSTAAEAASERQDSPSSSASAADVPEGDAEERQIAAETRSQTRTVATSVRQVESDWPLEQRPRSTTVQFATDPSWERPVQIVLAAVAISATVFWLTLTIIERRRRA